MTRTRASQRKQKVDGKRFTSSKEKKPQIEHVNVNQTTTELPKGLAHKVLQQRCTNGKKKSKQRETLMGLKKDCDVASSNLKFVGAHCSIAGGVSNAVTEAAAMGAKAFGLFVRNGRTWKLNPLNEEEAGKFKVACKEHGYPPHLILPHGSYLLNCGSSNPDVLQKSRDTLVHELKICESLGLILYNFHPGSACGDGSVDNCIQTIADSINMAHKKTKTIKTVIENMSCQGSTVGGKLEELRAIIDKWKPPKSKSEIPNS
ncbi:major apurinic/apyrimidinic endonuclease/3' repair diesterase apn1 [Elysia marginata]|uniref:Major apurinic/apyrimidinic endonuclease/3' repair diesterase apn1 n=1 Tax=Elysia marginata TaxID=1093978 RepID=A0AAV4HQR0_9GAST|nr:major apurinic/apyrimidinic endonuclease/3' repair diesterase apn1 [Elysia marginata]